MADRNEIVYPDENDILLLRKNFRLLANSYLSKSSLAYMLDTVQDVHSELRFEDSLVAKAAFILFQTISSHPFVDGNKRTAYGTADMFLRLNGYRLGIEPEDALEFIIKIATGKSNELVVRKWIRQHLKKIQR